MMFLGKEGITGTVQRRVRAPGSGWLVEETINEVGWSDGRIDRQTDRQTDR
jgi:hypothetical protein